MSNGIELGSTAKDVVTGFTGTVTAICYRLNDRPDVLIEGIDTHGQPAEIWINQGRVADISAPAI